MSPRYENRGQLALGLLVGLLLLANLLTLLLVALAPAERAAKAPALVTVFIVTLVISLLSIILLPRWLLRPYRQLVSEAERASVSSGGAKPRSEAEFVLETFQAVVARLQIQQRELETLSAQASVRAASAEQFSARIIASLPSGLVAFDAEGRATIVNPPARALLEVDGDASGKQSKEILHGVPALNEMVRQCLKTGELFRRAEVDAQSANGRVKRLGVTIAPVEFGAEDTARGAICLLTDITEITQLREQVAIKKNLENLGEMSAGLSHEFKNSLATLQGYAQLLLKIETNEAARAASTNLLQEVRNLTEMVTAFLNFARPQPLQVARVSLSELVNECAQELENFFSECRVQLEISGEFGEANADERMLRQALLNLLRNAAEAIDREAEERKVMIRGKETTEAGNKVWRVIEIEDTGRGINAHDAERIFIPFYTTKRTGHGVGLALAHRVITQHNGTLTATNSDNGGAIFTIRLPE